MGSSKKHKSDKDRSRDAKKRRHRSRSRSYSPERDRTDKHKHHKKHKRKERKDYDSDVEFVDETLPPPPKISKSHHPSPPTPPGISLVSKEYNNLSEDKRHTHSNKDDKYSSQSRDDKYASQSRDDKHTSQTRDDKHSSQTRDDKYSHHYRDDKHASHGKEERSSRHKRSPSPQKGGQSHESLSIEETNKLRAKLGLKPLEVGDSGPKTGSDIIKDDLGEFHHKPAVNIAEKEKAEKIKEKINTMKQKRLIESSLAAVKPLGASDSEDEDAVAWVQKSRKIEEEKKKAAERAKMLDQMDEEFGVGNLVKEDVQKELRNAYSDKDLKGLRVEHDLDNFHEGTVILTLKDKDVLAEDDDTLVNVNMIDDERYKKNILIKSKKPGYDAYDDSNFDEFGLSKSKVLEKYDEEIEGEKRDSFTIGMVNAKALKQKQDEALKSRLTNKRLESLQLIEPKIASDYYNEEELAKFKKPKKKIRKIRTKKKLKADDLINDSNDYLRDLGCRRRKPDQQNEDEVLDNDDLEAPKEDLSGWKVEPEDHNLDLRIKQKAQKLKGPITVIKPEVAIKTIKEEVDMSDNNAEAGNIILNSTAEFCRTLGDIPTYGQAGNRDENQEYLDFELDEIKQENVDDEMNGRGTWNQVDTDLSLIEPAAMEAILDEPSLDQGVGSALKLAMSKGYLQKEDAGRPSASRFAHLKAQNYSIEDKSYGDDDKFSRRDRFNGPTMDFKEKDGFKPNVKLEYIDDDGHVLNAKEAFRYLSHKFHGKGPGKNKVEKRMKKAEQEILMKRMSSTDTPLGTLTLLQAKQKETQSPFIVLSGSKQMQTASISKSKH